jgi:hypothetical protein
MSKLVTIKDAVTQASMEIGITQTPVTSVFGSKDQDIVQMGALMNAVADEIMLEEPYRITLGDDAWVTDADLQPKLFATTDTDIILFDARLAIDGLKYHFLQAKGLEFGEQFRAFSTRLNKLAARVNARVLDLDADESRNV